MMREAISTSRQMRLCFSSSGMNQLKPNSACLFNAPSGSLMPFGFECELECRTCKARGEFRLRHGLGLIRADLEQDHALGSHLHDDGGMEFAWSRWCVILLAGCWSPTLSCS